MNKTTYAIAGGVLIVAGIAGFGIAQAATAPTPAVSSGSSTVNPTVAPRSGSGATAPTATPTVAPASITAPGEVCDPHNLNDIICLAFHPDVAVVNMTSGPRAQEPLRSMTDQEKIALAHKACSVYASGGSASTMQIVATNLDAGSHAPADINNMNIFNIGALAYCNQFVTTADAANGAGFLWTLNAYRGMGEKAAIESFASKHVIQRP